jgi:hypothetical protein
MAKKDKKKSKQKPKPKQKQKVKIKQKPEPKPKKRSARGSKKGTPYERQICKLLSLWWTNGEKEDVFWRTSNSGGRATVRGSLKNQHGDVTATDPIGLPLIEKVLIEVKRGYSRDNIQNVFDAFDTTLKEQQYETWFKKCDVDVKAAGIKKNSWIIIVKRDRRADLVMMPRRQWRLFALDDHDFPTLQMRLDGRHIVMMLLDDFLLTASTSL